MQSEDVSDLLTSPSGGGNLLALNMTSAGSLPKSQGTSRTENNVRVEKMAGWSARRGGIGEYCTFFTLLLVTSQIPVAQSMSKDNSAQLTEASLIRILGDQFTPRLDGLDERLTKQEDQLRTLNSRLEKVENKPASGNTPTTPGKQNT